MCFCFLNGVFKIKKTQLCTKKERLKKYMLCINRNREKRTFEKNNKYIFMINVNK